MPKTFLKQAVVRRLKELGLPPALLEMDEFRQNFLFQRWVMFVRDGDKVANVHLVQPRTPATPLIQETWYSPERQSR